jgi:hypothetical protein
MTSRFARSARRPGRASLSRQAVLGGVAAVALVLGAAAVPFAAPAGASTAGTNATAATAAGVFAAGDVVVYRVGDGSSSLSGNAAPVFLDEYTPGGTLVQSIPMPTSDSGSTHELTASGTAASEGLLTLSADGHYLMLPGYHKPVGTSGVASTDDVTVARVGADGTVNTSTVLNEFADDNNVRGATSTDGSNIWVSGANGGIGYTTLGSTSFTQLSTKDVRQVAVAGGQLYVSSDKSSIGISKVGTGTPTSGSPALANLPGSPESGNDPYAFTLLALGGSSTPNTLYVADSSADKIKKFSLVGSSWVAEGNKTVDGVTGVTGAVVGGQAVLYATSSGSAGTDGDLYTVTDASGAGATMTGSVSDIASAPGKEGFRGVAMAPTATGTGTIAPAAWPGSSTVTTADATNVFGTDLSGLIQEGTYSSGGVMWAAQNTGKLWRLVPNGSGGWTPDTTNGWTTGKTLKYPTGSGTPDDEGVTLTSAGSAGGVYVSTERDADHGSTSRLSVLKYSVSGTATTLNAAQEWNLTADLPATDPNLGFEGITWIPDSYLTSVGFKDSSTGTAYNPAHYGSHGAGVFFVSVEGTGEIYGYVLQDSGAFTQIAAMSSGMDGVMELQWEPQASRLWVVCDDTCDGQHRTMKVNSAGTFALSAIYNRPTGMSNFNNEGFAVSGSAECVGGSKPVYWSDDSNDASHALRRGTITC